MIKGAIGGEFKSDFNDEKKTPYIKELEVKKSKKSESYESEFPEESEVLDNPEEKKDLARKRLLGSVHPEVMDPNEVKIDHVEISYGYTHNDPSENVPGHDATDSRFDGRMNEELVDDSHSMVKRAINADFTDTDFNREKPKPTLSEPKKKKSKKNESTETYRSVFEEDFDDEQSEDAYDLIIEIEELDSKISEFPTEQLSEEDQDKLKSALEGLKNSAEMVMDLL